MSCLYVETSAVLAWLLNEARAPEVISSINSADVVLTSVLTDVETRRSLSRGAREGLITHADKERLSGLFQNELRSWAQLEIISEVRERAAKEFPLEPVRSLDSIHLASALLLLQTYPDLTVLSLDERILKNAESLGIALALS